MWQALHFGAIEPVAATFFRGIRGRRDRNGAIVIAASMFHLGLSRTDGGVKTYCVDALEATWGRDGAG